MTHDEQCDIFAEETDDPRHADERNFYKVEKWSKNGLFKHAMLYAGNDLERARAIYEAFRKRRPRSRLTIRQQTRVLNQWPKE